MNQRIIIACLAMISLSACGFLTPEGRQNIAAGKQCRALYPEPESVKNHSIGLIPALIEFSQKQQNPEVQQYYATIDACTEQYKKDNPVSNF